jgi:hypothetical protein
VNEKRDGGEENGYRGADIADDRCYAANHDESRAARCPPVPRPEI